MLKFSDLPSHTQQILLREAIAFKRNYFTDGINWIQQKRDLDAHIKEHLPEITDEQLNELIFRSDDILCRVMHIPHVVFDYLIQS